MDIKITNYKIKIDYPDRFVEIIIGKDQAQRYSDRYLPNDPELLEGFINGHELDGLTISCGMQYLLALPKEFNHLTVYHEVFHVCMRIWYDAGANLSFPENDEVITYMIGTVVKRIEEIYEWASKQSLQNKPEQAKA